MAFDWNLAAGVFLSEAAISYLAAKLWASRVRRLFWKALGFGVLLDAAIYINQMGAVLGHWNMLLPSLVGGTAGLALSFIGVMRED